MLITGVVTLVTGAVTLVMLRSYNMHKNRPSCAWWAHGGKVPGQGTVGVSWRQGG